jgi:lipopolysaccharide export system permease protein
MKPSTLALLSEPTPRHLGELSWRVGLILAALNCVIFALAATRVNPRVGRSAGLVFALFAFTTYYNLLTLGESWIARGRVGFGAYMLLLHGGILLLSAGWLLARHHGWGGAWRRRLPGGGR